MTRPNWNHSTSACCSRQISSWQQQAAAPPLQMNLPRKILKCADWALKLQRRGELVEDWLLSQNASILNNGTATCVNRGTGGLSTLDVTTVSNACSTGTEWTVGEDHGSDHLSITPTIRCDVPAASASQHRASTQQQQQQQRRAAALITSDPPRAISYASAGSLIHRTLTDLPPTNSMTAGVYGGFFWS